VTTGAISSFNAIFTCITWRTIYTSAIQCSFISIENTVKTCSMRTD